MGTEDGTLWVGEKDVMIVGFGGFSAEEVDDVDSFLFLFLDQNDIFFGIQRERQ